MKHKITNKEKLDSHHWLISIELIPESDQEKEAIKKVEFSDATHNERELIDNYLIFCLGDRYSVVSLVSQNKNILKVKAFLN